MPPFLITFLWIVSLLVMWAYWSNRCDRLAIDLNWTRGARERAAESFDLWQRRAQSLEKLLAQARAISEDDATQLKQRDETIAVVRGLNEHLRDRLARAELICTGNLNKSFRARLPWPTVIARAFAED